MNLTSHSSLKSLDFKENAELFTRLLKSVQGKGRIATGLVTLPFEGSNIHICKKNVVAEDFLKIKRVKKILEEPLRMMIGHCRFPTKGDPKHSYNNHPFMHDNLVLIHQGIIINDEELMEQYQLKPEGDTDSWMIIQLINHFFKKDTPLLEAIRKAHHQLQGSWACILIDKREPDKLYMFCHNKSIHVVYLPEKEMFIFSTEQEELQTALIQNKRYFGMFEEYTYNKTAHYEIKDNICMVLGDEPTIHQFPETILYSSGGGYKQYVFPKRDDEFKSEYPVRDVYGNLIKATENDIYEYFDALDKEYILGNKKKIERKNKGRKKIKLLTQ